MGLRIYIAGGSSERESCAAMITKAEAHGLQVVYNWTQSPGYHRELTEREWLGQGLSDLTAVRVAHLVWCMVPEDKSEGMASELGAALALGRRVILSGPQRPFDPFHRLAERRFALHDTALEWVILEATRYHGN